MRFDIDRYKADQSAWSFGGYASYMKNGLFADLLVKDDVTRLKIPYAPAVGRVRSRC